MSSRCHIGRLIVYDTVTNLSWSVNIRQHGIVNVIDNILNTTWLPSEEIGREVPAPKVEEDCVVSPSCSAVDSGSILNVSRVGML